MADTPDDDEPETLVQKAVKIGLITVPLMMYVSWAHKKFVPCPQVRCQQGRASLFQKSAAKGKRKNSKGMCQVKQERNRERCKNPCQDSKSAKQERKNDSSKDFSEAGQKYHDQRITLSAEPNKGDREPTKYKYMDYIKRSTEECCDSVSKHVKKYGKSRNRKSTKIDEPCDQHRSAKVEDDTTNSQSETISPEALDELFEEHFQKCVDDFKQHKLRLEKQQNNWPTKPEYQPPIKADKTGNYLECLADLNLDKDFDCDPNFHSKDSNTPYVVKDYKCKTPTGQAAREDGTDFRKKRSLGYLECLSDLNMDKHFEEKQDFQDYSREQMVKNECCPESKVLEEANHKKDTDDYKQEPNQKVEELCKKRPLSSSKNSVDDTICGQVKFDDCDYDSQLNTKDTDGKAKEDPCAYRPVRERDTDDDALKDFWHACGPPKGLRTGCRADGCDDPCGQQK